MGTISGKGIELVSACNCVLDKPSYQIPVIPGRSGGREFQRSSRWNPPRLNTLAQGNRIWTLISTGRRSLGASKIGGFPKQNLSSCWSAFQSCWEGVVSGSLPWKPTNHVNVQVLGRKLPLLWPKRSSHLIAPPHRRRADILANYTEIGCRRCLRS